MSLQLEVENLADVEEASRGLYVEKEGGGFRIDVAGLETQLEAEFTAKLAAHETNLKAQIASLRSDRDSVALERVAVEIASRIAIAGSHELLLPFIRTRLVASDAGGVFAVTAKDAPTLEHLTEEFRNDVRFSRVINGASPLDQARHQQRVAETLGLTAAPPSVTRQAFEKMTSAKRSEFARMGGKIVDG
jgi:hypothetical protein